MNKTNRTPSNAVPATLISKSSGPLGSYPFIPSSVPGSDQQWKKSATRKAKTRMSNKISTKQEDNSRTTEYDDKFVEWKMPSTEQIIAHDRKHALTGFFETDMMVSDWKSEQKRSYNQKEIEFAGKTIAGVSNPVHENIADTFIWTNEKSKAHKNHQGKTREPIFTENSSQFKWPSEVQRVQPLYEGKNTTIQLDMDNKGTQEWQSEYDQRCAELRNKQAELLANQSTLKNVAGVINVPHEQIPTFYAWDEDESMPRHIPVPIPSTNPRSVSEYQTKFIAPEVDHSGDTTRLLKSSAQNNTLNLFEDVKGTNESKSDLSEYTTQYVKHNVPVPSTTKSISNLKYPVQFAWELEHTDPNKTVLDSKPRMKRPKDPKQDESEYQRKFNWPNTTTASSSSVTAGVPTKKKIDSEPIMALDDVDLNASKWQSEYDERCALLRRKQQDLVNNNSSQKHVAGVPSKLKDQIPTNYAWETSSTQINSTQSTVAVHNVNEDSRTSEYDDKFSKSNIKKLTMDALPVAGKSHTKGHTDLNIFSEESINNATSEDDLSYEIVSKPLLSEYDENLNAFASTNHSASSNIIKKQIDLVPAQFAWERIDPILEKAPKTQPHPIVATNPSMIEKSEYNSQFAWPPTVSLNIVANKKATGTASHDGDIIVPIPGKSVDDSNDANQWMSEYDDHATDIKKTSTILGTSSSVPAAGIVTIKQGDLPHFYAWLDEEATKPVKPIVPKYTCNEQMNSEYDDNYINWPSNRVEKIIPPSSSENYNVITNTINGESTSLITKTEYDDNYLPHSLEKIKMQFNPYVNKNTIDTVIYTKSLNADSNVIPPQFAWPLVDAVPNKKPVVLKNSIKDTEYNSQYVWRELNDIHQFSKSLMVDRLIENPIPIDDHTNTWISEYDERCETVQKKLRNKELDTIKPIAGIVSPGHAEISAFCAWKPKENQNDSIIPVTNTIKSVNPDLSEYSANFKTWPIKVENQNKSRQTELQYNETFKNFTFLCNDRNFSGVSEYDAQYQVKENDSNVANIVANRNKYVDTNPIYTTIESNEKVIHRSNNNSNPAFQTESSDNFKWPQPIKDLKNPLHWNKSKVVIGAAVVNNKLSKSIKEVPFKSARLHQDPNSLKCTTMASNTLDFTPVESEAKANYSWPHSQETKNNNQRNTHHTNDRSQDLSNSSRTTVNLIKNNQPFIPSQKYDLSEILNTGIISTDSLVPDTNDVIHTDNTTAVSGLNYEPSTTSKLSQISNFPGLRSTLDRSNSYHMHRSRSAPAARRNHTHMSYETYKPKSKVLSYVEDSSNNPVLMNKRYPYVSKKQLGRWTTETSDSFKWKKNNNPALLVTTTYMNTL